MDSDTTNPIQSPTDGTTSRVCGELGVKESCRGWSLPILPILVLLIATLTYFYGWPVLAIVAGMIAMTGLGTAIYDKLTHATRCRYCNVIKAELAAERGIDIERITTFHEVNYDDHMEVQTYIDGKEDILVDIDLNERILDWPSTGSSALLRPVDIGCRPSPSIPAETLMQNGSQAWLMFFAVSSALNESGCLDDLGVAAMACHDCVKTRFGYPNDEGRPEHPLYTYGMREAESSILEVVDSPWVAEVTGQMSESAARIWGGRGMEAQGQGRATHKHFIMPLKEATFECIASELRVERFFKTFDEAMRHGVAKMRED